MVLDARGVTPKVLEVRIVVSPSVTLFYLTLPLNMLTV